MKRIVLATALVLGAAACQQQAATSGPAAVTESEAATQADATQTAWTSQDVARIEAIYAKDVIAFDPMEAALSTTWDNWHRLQQGFAAMKFDAISVPDRRIQILDGDTFVVSGTGNLTSTGGELKSAAMRFTDVYRRQADGKWLIVNEHVSMAPAAEPAAGSAAEPGG